MTCAASWVTVRNFRCGHHIQCDGYRCRYFVLHSFGKTVVLAMAVSASDCWPRTHRCKPRNSGTDRTDKPNAPGQHTSGADRSINLGLRSCICIAKSGLQVGKSFFYVYGFVQLMWLAITPVMACASSGVNAPLAMSAAPRLTELRLRPHRAAKRLAKLKGTLPIPLVAGGLIDKISDR